MAEVDLSSPDAIRKLAEAYDALLADPAKPYRGWCERLVKHLEYVAAASLEKRSSLEFQTALWNDETINSTGRGTVSMDGALANADLRGWLASRSLESLPDSEVERTKALEHLTSELKDRLRPPVVDRTPRLKIFRVLASLYPHFFTTVADVGRMERLHRAMLPGKPASEVGRHQAVLRRLDDVLGPAPRDLAGWVRRMTLPWRLVEVMEERSGPDVEKETPLVPLPAARRSRGMTAVKGYFETVLRVLDFVGDGVSWQDLHDFVKNENAALKASSVNVNLNVFRRELGVLTREGDQVKVTDAGRRLLAEEDPSVLAPWLLTRILGIDHALVALRDGGPQAPADLVRTVQAANKGWTSKFAPQAILSWLRSFGVIEVQDDERLGLTQRGQAWAARVHWKPERYEGTSDEEVEAVVRPPPAVAGGTYDIPSLADVTKHLPVTMQYPADQVAALHAGLWAHPTRHFAILTGLSGSGKTSLARDYARAVIAATSKQEDPPRRFLVVPVSPGWTDPSTLLGYPNPLRTGEYVATEFVHFLVSCVENPEVIHFAVLDEMNLSHPEQYLAPLLSGMELGSEPITLHDEDADVGGIPGQLDRYPSNLVLIGTVNMDETTHGLSDKILDRAVTLEFWNINIADYPRWGKTGLSPEHEQQVRNVLSSLVEALAPLRLHFGWRVVDDVLAFVKRAASDGGLGFDDALDWIVYSKVIPKLRGFDSPQFRKTFEACQSALAGYALSRSEAKVGELLRDLKETGSARFWR
ncbi:McrB family protein [Anaeromyxobacter sp. SG26]|uniref:McrB family protein n=1 Tax=Anaeromyxobacter sp. SG26 TaxID=2925407 RepID=UPI001F568FBC|nr:hypothetical protein [Anaeromyxobacter sp. SG26]